ncbi:hypothetical protein K1719_012124 [Acacia pycnantha]|nr:hypothetical protein K1719_012124 [Acacia pycnantha]
MEDKKQEIKCRRYLEEMKETMKGILKFLTKMAGSKKSWEVEKEPARDQPLMLHPGPNVCQEVTKVEFAEEQQILRLLGVAERALFLWNNDHIRNLITQNSQVILPIIFPALEKNTRGHWNQAVQSLTLNVRKIFSDADQALFDECLMKFQQDEMKEREKQEKRESIWKKLEEVAAAKVVSNEAVLVSRFAASVAITTSAKQ